MLWLVATLNGGGGGGGAPPLLPQTQFKDIIIRNAM